LEMSWVAMSVQPSSRAEAGMLASEYQLRFTVCAYVPAGEACCTLVVVTTPTDLPRGDRGQGGPPRLPGLPLSPNPAVCPPASFARYITERTSLPCVVLHWPARAAALKPMV
jgi:hypothetical protein